MEMRILSSDGVEVILPLRRHNNVGNMVELVGRDRAGTVLSGFKLYEIDAFIPLSSGVSKRACERTHELSGVRERSELFGASE